MRIRMVAALALVAALGAGARGDDQPTLPDVKTFDKLVIDTLRTVHDRGADLYNESKDFAGTFRMYQGALLTTRPLLGHRPEAQKLIDAGLAAAEKEPDPARKAVKLHEAIEATRKHLKVAIGLTKPVDPPVKKPVEKKPALPVAPPPREPKRK